MEKTATLTQTTASSDAVSSTSFVLQRKKIEFEPAKKHAGGFYSNGFRIETLNPNSRKREFCKNDTWQSKRVDCNESGESGLDPDIFMGITFRRIGAGLQNLGNTCFLNSVLQCLTYTEPLAAYLQSGKHQNSCHVAGFCALCAIQKHVSRALQSTGRSLVPKDLVANLRCISRNFRNARQEDAHEYMVNLLQSMHKCCLPSGVPSESPAAYEKSLVHKIFGGRLRSQVECQRCGYCSNKFDPFTDLSLEIYKADTLPTALRNFTAAEMLDGGERHYHCQQCKQKVRAKKQLTVHKAPYVLTIHLKRFHALDPTRKVDKKVQYDRSLDMKPFVSDPHDKDLKYSLYGVLVHFGHSTHSGHYLCFVRTSSGMWYLLNDNEVRQVAEKTVLEQKAYMLFYVRDRKNIISRKPVDVVRKDNVGTVGSTNIADLVLKQISKEKTVNDSFGNKSHVADTSAHQKDVSKSGLSPESTQKEASWPQSNEMVMQGSQVPKAEQAFNHSFGNKSHVADSSVLQKDASKSGISLESTQKEASLRQSNGMVMQGCQVSKAESTLCNPFSKDSSTVVPVLNSDQGDCSLAPAESIISKDETSRIENGTFAAGFKPDVSIQVSTSGCDPQGDAAFEPVTEGISPKINLILSEGSPCKILSGNSDKLMKNVPRQLPYLDEKASSLIDPHRKPNEPSSSTQGGVMFPTVVRGNSPNDQAGVNGKDNVNELSKSTLSDTSSEQLPKNATNLTVHGKVRKRPSKGRVPRMYLGLKLSTTSVRLRKKKHKKGKHRSMDGRDRIKDQLMGNLESGPSTSMNDTATSLGSNSRNKVPKSSPKKGGAERKSRRDSPVDLVNGEKREGDIQNVAEHANKHLHKSSTVSEINLQNASNCSHAENSERDASDAFTMKMLQGMSETTIARWDGIEMPTTSSAFGSYGPEKMSIGHVPDEWDEEYDRGKRKKVRLFKHTFGGPNPFQEVVTKKLQSKKMNISQFKKLKKDRSSSGNQPFRI